MRAGWLCFNLLQGAVGVRMPSAEELAGYILTTGDQASVVDLIEGVVNNEKMSEEQALVYVETIKVDQS